jgi:cobalt/nickel transport system permease protein
MHASPLPLHIPDGFLSVWVSIICWIISIIGIGFALKRVSQDLGERQVPMMGVLAAAIFAGQMLNFTVVGGSSGHLLGAALATILLGPWASVLILTCVVAIQALIFQDGGLLVLGANIFNMAIIGSAVAYMVYWTVQRIARNKPWGLFVGGFLAAWFSILITALAASLELAISGTSPANIAVPAMAGIHALIGIGEGLITVGALAFIYASRPDLLRVGNSPVKSGRFVWVVGLLIAITLAVLSPLASAFPDGLERVAEQKGFLDTAQSPFYNIIPDYVFPGIKSEAAATIIAAIIGTLIVFTVALLVARSRRKRYK